MFESILNENQHSTSCCQCLASQYTALGPWSKARIQFFISAWWIGLWCTFIFEVKMSATELEKACWWRTSYNRDGAATDEIIKEIISRFKDHPSIKIVDKLDRKTPISFCSIPPKLGKLAWKNYIWVSLTTSKWDYCEWRIFLQCRENSLYHSLRKKTDSIRWIIGQLVY